MEMMSHLGNYANDTKFKKKKNSVFEERQLWFNDLETVKGKMVRKCSITS